MLSAQVSELALIGGWEIELATSELTWSDGVYRIHDLDQTFQPTVGAALEFYPPDVRGSVQSALNTAVANGTSFDFEQPLITAKGRRIWVRVLGRAELRDGRPVNISGAIQDITARHESEESRRELELQLFQAQKMETLGTLAGGIAHDFNNLLTGIIGYHELAADSIPKDDPAHACLAEARAASLRARELVDQILTFSRQSAGEEHEPVDLTLVIKEATRFLRSTIASQISIETDIPSDCGRVLANTTQIYQVILNLGSNSAHAMRDGGGSLKISLQAVEVAAERAATLSGVAPGRYARLSVRDNGHGMDPTTLRRIFDPFFTTKKTREGTGLGLAVVHGIVRAHRGAIDVESEEGVGTTFHVYLPIASSTEPVAESSQTSTPLGTGQHIYVVDDEEIVGRFVRLALKGVGYQVETFHSADLCLEALRNERGQCDLLLTDQTMPGMQGTELAVAARAIIPGLPVVIMSGYFSKVPLQSLGELHNAQLLAKPFTTEELAAALHRAFYPDEAKAV
jgi:signal transduction histidine kinase/CheY-like chemotaxis protein